VTQMRDSADVIGTRGSVALPQADGTLEQVAIRDPLALAPIGAASTDRSRQFYAAAHVVVDPLTVSADDAGNIDWATTLRFREHLWDQGLGVAEAMDTAQRGMGLPVGAIRDLIRETSAAARARRAPLVCGVGTPNSDARRGLTLDDIAQEYLDEATFVAEQGGIPVLMASRALRRVAHSWEEYIQVYGAVLDGLAAPAFLHWLGPAFDPELHGYWGVDDAEAAVDRLVEFITDRREHISGIKISLLREDLELRVRAVLPPEVTLFTGDDFNYPSLIIGDGERCSHALLGAFNPLARLAGVVLDRLDAGDTEVAHDLLVRSQPLSREVFAAPTQYYKTGVTLLAWLNGHQSHFRMLERRESDRDVLHLSRVFRLAAEGGLLEDPDLARHRMQSFLSIQGVSA
jgi:hypothetical protein